MIKQEVPPIQEVPPTQEVPPIQEVPPTPEVPPLYRKSRLYQTSRLIPEVPPLYRKPRPSINHFDRWCSILTTTTALTLLLSLSTICMKEVQTEEVPLDFTSLYSFCLSFSFTSLMKESMITDRPLVLTPPEVARHAVVFFTPYSRSYFSHPNFTSCKLQNTHKVPTHTDHWQVRCSPIDSGITHNVKQTRDPK